MKNLNNSWESNLHSSSLSYSASTNCCTLYRVLVWSSLILIIHFTSILFNKLVWYIVLIYDRKQNANKCAIKRLLCGFWALYYLRLSKILFHAGGTFLPSLFASIIWRSCTVHFHWRAKPQPINLQETSLHARTFTSPRQEILPPAKHLDINMPVNIHRLTVVIV